jgi:hypothetical protein
MLNSEPAYRQAGRTLNVATTTVGGVSVGASNMLSSEQKVQVSDPSLRSG